MNRHFARAAALLLATVLACASMTGCGLYDVLGIDTHDYASELRLNTLPTDGEVAAEICLIRLPRQQSCNATASFALCWAATIRSTTPTMT